MAYDILIKSGAILSGKSEPPVLADLGIKNDKIDSIGDLGNTSAKIIVNASGKYVTPGFIDLTNHSDTHLTLFTSPDLQSLVMQGITTIFGGNCGASLAPLGSKTAIESIKKWADPRQINVNWATVGEFLDEAEKIKPAVNFGTFAGYGTLRRSVLDNQIRLLNLEEREKIKLLLRNALEQGAFGMSLGLSYGHERISTTEEIIDIASVLGEFDGIIKIHLRSEGKEMLASVNEAVRIARETGLTLEISHLKAIGRKSWPSLPIALELIERANATGAKINFDVSPYRTSGSPLYLLIPAWARQGGFAELFRRLDDPPQKSKIIEDLKNYTLHYDRILITSAKVKNIVGKTIAEVAKTAELSPEEAMLEAVRANEGRVSIIGRTISLKNTDLAMQNKNSFIASDGFGMPQEAEKSGNLAHPRSFGAFPHFWHRLVTDSQKIPPPEAIRKITSGPAEKMGLKKRGVITEGNFADLAVFDSKILRDRATYRNPFRYPAGMEWVIINGKIAVAQGKYQEARSGKILRRKEN